MWSGCGHSLVCRHSKSVGNRTRQPAADSVAFEYQIPVRNKRARPMLNAKATRAHKKTKYMLCHVYFGLTSLSTGPPNIKQEYRKTILETENIYIIVLYKVV